MSELLTTQTSEEVTSIEEAKNVNDSDDASNDSDADSVDSEGYDKLDPYASAAKKIDKRNKIVQEYHQRPLVKATKSIIANREAMTYFEKNTLKYIILVGLLAYLIYKNVTGAASGPSGMRSISEMSKAEQPSTTSVLSSLVDVKVFADMQRELVMLGIAVGGYVIMASINNHLDRVEEE